MFILASLLVSLLLMTFVTGFSTVLIFKYIRKIIVGIVTTSDLVVGSAGTVITTSSANWCWNCIPRAKTMLKVYPD